MYITVKYLKVRIVDINIQKEQFSIAYVRAVSSVAGYSCQAPEVDDQSIDINIKSSKRPYPQLDAQLKATAQLDLIKADHINFALPIKNYNDLRGNNVLVPRILVCVILPNDDPKCWIEQNEEQLSLMKCAYWMSLKEAEETTNTTSVTVKIPILNTFTPSTLKKLIECSELSKACMI